MKKLKMELQYLMRQCSLVASPVFGKYFIEISADTSYSNTHIK